LGLQFIANQSKEIFKKVAERFPNNYFSFKNLGFIAFQYDKNYPQALIFILSLSKLKIPIISNRI
jgi:hypothetical protein